MDRTRRRVLRTVGALAAGVWRTSADTEVGSGLSRTTGASITAWSRSIRGDASFSDMVFTRLRLAFTGTFVHCGRNHTPAFSQRGPKACKSVNFLTRLDIWASAMFSMQCSMDARQADGARRGCDRRRAARGPGPRRPTDPSAAALRSRRESRRSRRRSAAGRSETHRAPRSRAVPRSASESRRRRGLARARAAPRSGTAGPFPPR